MARITAKSVARKVANAIGRAKGVAIDIELTLPLRDGTLLSRRDYNKYVKDSLRETTEMYQKGITQLHFLKSAASKYGHAKRPAGYNRMKNRKYGSAIDLVKTGGTKARMMSEAEITVGGTGDGGTVHSKLKRRFSFNEDVIAANKKKFGNKGGAKKYNAPRAATSEMKGGVDIAQMRKEITTMTADERRWFVRDFSHRFDKRMREHLKNRKTTRKIHR